MLVSAGVAESPWVLDLVWVLELVELVELVWVLELVELVWVLELLLTPSPRRHPSRTTSAISCAPGQAWVRRTR